MIRREILGLLGGVLLAAGAAGDTAPQDLAGGAVAQDVAFVSNPQGGRPLLAVAYAFSSKVRVFRANGAGAFLFLADYATGTNPGDGFDFPRQVIAGHFTSPVFEDLLVLHSGTPTGGFLPVRDGTMQVLAGTANGAFLPLEPQSVVEVSGEGSFASRLLAGDLNNDGFDEVISGYTEKNAVRVWGHRGAGRFEASALVPVGHRTPAVALADLDGDGFAEVLAAGDGTLTILRNNSASGGAPSFSISATFGLAGISGTVTAIAAADLDRSGAVDVAVASSGGTLRVLRDVSVAGSHTTLAPALTLPSGAVPEGEARLRDLAVADWNGDGFADLLAVDRGANAVLIYAGPTINVWPQTLATPAAPRRLALGDYDGNGTVDLAVSAEADFYSPGYDDPGNVDARAIPNTTSFGGTLALAPVSSVPVGDQFPNAAETGLGLSFVKSGEFLALEPRTNRVLEIDGGGGIDDAFDLAALGLTNITGVCSKEDEGLNRFYLSRSGSPTLYEIRDGAIDDTFNFSARPVGPFGFSDMWYGEWAGAADDQYAALSPERQELILTDDDGGVHRTFTLAEPFTRLAVNPATKRGYLARDNRSTVTVVDLNGSGGVVPAPVLATVDLAARSPLLRNKGIAGLSWAGGSDGLLVLTTDRLLIPVGDPQSPSVPASNGSALRQGRGVVSLAVDAVRGDVYALDRAGAPLLHRFDFAGTREATFALAPALAAIADFDPWHVAYDAGLDELVVMDRWSARFAVFARSGAYVTALAWPAAARTFPVQGFAIDSDTGEYIVRFADSVTLATRAGAVLERRPAPRVDSARIAFADGNVFALEPANRLVESRTAQSAWLESLGAGNVDAIAALPDPVGGRVQFFGYANGTQRLLRFELEPPAASASGWSLYE